MHRVVPSVVVPLSATEYPVPGGRPEMIADTVALWLTSIAPVVRNVLGPVIT